jgi:hypothetical protein
VLRQILVLLLAALVSGAQALVCAADKEERAAQAPVKIVQGTLVAFDVKGKTATVEIVKGQTVKLKLSDGAADQLERVGKKGERVELRLLANDVVQTVAVGTGP